MKKSCYYFVIIFCFYFGLTHMSKAITLPPPISDYLQSQSISEDGVLPKLATDGKVFVEYIVANKDAIMTDFIQVAPDSRRQLVVLTALEFSPPQSYVAVLNQILDLRQSGALNSGAVGFAFRARMVKFGFISHNYQHPQIQSLIQRAQALNANDSKLLQYLAAISNGTQRTSDAQYIVMNELAEPETLPPQ